MQKITASIIIIGNEILSGRVQDLNISFIASKLPDLGIHLEETRIIPDQKQRIIDTVLEMSSLYDYVFTTGGIGPTHDDITSESIAAAFNLPFVRNEEAYRRILEWYSGMGRTLLPASEKMAMMPEGAKLIDNDATAAPGFIVNNIYVMAGIPNIMQSMFMNILPSLRSGNPIISYQLSILAGESKIALGLTDLQNKYLEIEMGSYPFIHEKEHATNIVLRGKDIKNLEEAFSKLKIMVKDYEILN